MLVLNIKYKALCNLVIKNHQIPEKRGVLNVLGFVNFNDQVA